VITLRLTTVVVAAIVLVSCAVRPAPSREPVRGASNACLSGEEVLGECDGIAVGPTQAVCQVVCRTGILCLKNPKECWSERAPRPVPVLNSTR
jgi:hypothetical protein